MDERLDALRREIDDVDAQLAALLVKRIGLVDQVSAHKRESGLPVLDGAREEAVVAKARKRAGPDCADDAEALMRCVMERSRMRQQAQRNEKNDAIHREEERNG